MLNSMIVSVDLFFHKNAIECWTFDNVRVHSTRSIVGCRNVEVFSVSRNQRQYISWCGYCCGRVTVTLIGSHPAPDLLMVKYKRSWVLSPPLFTKCQLDKYFSSISFTQFIFSVEICTQIGPL